MPTMIDFLQELPKAELHIHIEGSLEPDLMFKIERQIFLDLLEEHVQAFKY
jgi:adenosine deaminase